MSGMLFALALFGCSDDGSACQRIAAPVSTYESRVACMANQDEALNSDAAMEADAPSVFAKCLTPAQLAQVGRGTVDMRGTALTFAKADG